MRALLPLLGAAALVAGCPSRPAPSAEDGGRGLALRVPVPAGWQARPRDSTTLEVGRDGEVVLQIHRERLGSREKLPSTEALQAAFLAGAGGAQARVVRAEENANLTFVALELGGGEPPAMAFVGIKRLGEDWFLCRSTPGKGADALQIAVAACRGLEWQ